jgi:hypothetical protein
VQTPPVVAPVPTALIGQLDARRLTGSSAGLEGRFDLPAT